MRIHFIAIGGAAMHNLALALHVKGNVVTGSDDAIAEPSRSRLAAHGLLPEKEGWYPEKLSKDLDAVILGMHAHRDNPELLRAQELGLCVYSYPEYLYEHSKDKLRVVIGGSHGKTSITAMIMHVLRYHGRRFDFMVGAQLEGFDTMVSLQEDTDLIILEGDEYLSSPIDLRPKFHWYKPHIAVLSGIAWDHVNVFPTWENYVEQFELFMDKIEKGGCLFFYKNDDVLCRLTSARSSLKSHAYDSFNHEIDKGITSLILAGKKYPLQIFGEHNLQNISAAYGVCSCLDISDEDFAQAMTSFKGAARRLETLYSDSNGAIFLDFAHSPSKLKATVNAVKMQYPERELVACMELHTFSSLNKTFLKEYKGSMDRSDKAFVIFDQAVVKSKRLEMLTKEDVAEAFGLPINHIFTCRKELEEMLSGLELNNSNLLMMSSGTFSGLNIKTWIENNIG